MPCPRSPRVGAAPEHLGGASVVRAVQGRRGPGRGPARWWSSALRTGSRGPESWGAGPGDWSPGVLFCLGWSLTARVLSGARLLPFLSWGADAASASCRLLLPRQQPRVRHGAQSQTGVAGSRTPGPGREVAGEGPWAGLCVGGVSPASALPGWSPARLDWGAAAPPGPTVLGGGSGIPRYLWPFQLPQQGAGLLCSPGLIWNELPRVSAAEGRAAADSRGSGSTPSRPPPQRPRA